MLKPLGLNVGKLTGWRSVCTLQLGEAAGVHLAAIKSFRKTDSFRLQVTFRLKKFIVYHYYNCVIKCCEL